MGIFEATTFVFDNKTTAILSHKVNQFDRSPMLVSLVVEHDLLDNDRLPFAYHYEESTASQPTPVLKIIAGPGVSIQPPLPSSRDRDVVLMIIRVQDPKVIPAIGAPIRSTEVLGSYIVNAPVSSIPGLQLSTVPPINFFKVDRLENGVAFKHYYSRSALVIRVPQSSNTYNDPPDAKARFAFEFNPDGELDSVDNPLLRIVKTRDVSVGISTNFQILGSGQPARDSAGYFKAWNVDHIGLVPAQGESLTPTNAWHEVTRFDRTPALAETLALAAFDVSVGFIPVVGDLVDVAEFIYALFTGRDRWGRKVTPTDMVILGIGALLPVVSGAGLRVLRRFGSNADAVWRVIRKMQRAGLNDEDIEVIQAAERAVKSGRRLSAADLERFREVLAKLDLEPPNLDDLLNVDKSGFVQSDLQELYRRYVQTHENAASPREWALRQTRGRARGILEGILGSDFVRRARRSGQQSTRPVFLDDVPMPSGFDRETAEAHIEVLLNQAPRLLERLGSLLDAVRSADALTQFVARTKIHPWQFRILKGNIAEILSRETQLSILREIVQNQPSSRLISGVKMRVADEAGNLAQAQLFSDNIAAFERGGNLYITGVFEVKSGYRGGQEATAQIFDWIEDVLTENSQLVIPRRSRRISVDGTEQIISRQKVYRYAPDGRGTGRVVFLTSAPRYLITAQGVSHLGMDSAMQVAARVERRELSVTSQQMDFLAAQIASRIQ